MNPYQSVSAETIHRFNRMGPRYTSYPTVPVWDSGDFGEDFARLLKREGARGGALSLYVHLPFCSRLCTFCGCNQHITTNKPLAERYLDALEREADQVAAALGARKAVRQLHLGGGTPTHFSTPQLRRLAAILEARFDLDRGGEMALEAHPRVTTDEQLEALAELGFNRVSFGVQDLDPAVQRAINRGQTVEMTRRVFDKARALGFASINIDLVYGLPKQTVATFERTMEQVHEMGPDRLAVYSFAYIPNMFKGHRRAIKPGDLPSPEEKVAVYLASIRFFMERGYLMIGMDHYAREGDELARAWRGGTLHRNFMGYTTLKGLSMVGLGVSSISDFGDAYFQKEKDVFAYMDRVEAGAPPIHRRMLLSDDDLLRREVIETLMCQGAVDLDAACSARGLEAAEYFATELGAMDALAGEGLLERDGGRIQLTDLGVLFMRNAAMPFDVYLADRTRVFNFSKTV